MCYVFNFIIDNMAKRIRMLLLIMVCCISVACGQRKTMETEIRVAEPMIPRDTANAKIFTVKDVSFAMIDIKGGIYCNKSASKQSVCDTISDFMIGETEVTQELWQAVMGHNPSTFKGDLQRPVEHISWADCQRFIKKLNALTGHNFRLPTLIEWKYVSLVDDSIDYKNIYMPYAYYNEEDTCKTQPVKIKQPNGLGLYGIYGNVWEWTQDKYIIDHDVRSVMFSSMKYHFYKRDVHYVNIKVYMHRYYSAGLRLVL